MLSNFCFLLLWLSVEVENWTFHLTHTQCTIHGETFTSPAWLTKRGRAWKMVLVLFCFGCSSPHNLLMTQTYKWLSALRALCALCLHMICMSQKGTNPTWLKPGECIKSCLSFACRIPESYIFPPRLEHLARVAPSPCFIYGSHQNRCSGVCSASAWFLSE